jgi:hypothetical protein
MTIEELQAQLQEARASIDALNVKNKDLITEKRKLQSKVQEVDLEHYNKIIDENEFLKGEHSKIKKQYETDTKKLSEDLAKKDSFLSKTILTDGLSKSLLASGVDKQFLPAALAMLEKQAKVVQDGDNYSAFIGDKSSTDFVVEWMNGEGKIFTMKAPDTGAGARGGNGGGSSDDRKYFDKTNVDFSLTKQAEIFKTNPELYKTLKG